MVKVSGKNDIKARETAIKNSAIYRRYVVMGIVSLIGFIVLAAASVIHAAMNKEVHIKLFFYTTVCLALFLSSVWKQFRMNPAVKDKINGQSLTDAGFDAEFAAEGYILAAGSGAKTKGVIGNYPDIRKARFKEGWFILDIYNRGAFAFPESDIVSGTADELRELFLKNLGSRYKEG